MNEQHPFVEYWEGGLGRISTSDEDRAAKAGWQGAITWVLSLYDRYGYALKNEVGEGLITEAGDDVSTHRTPPHTEVRVDKLPICHFCEEQAEFDGKTVIGPWAYMCRLHYAKYGIGLGLGRGQHLIVRGEQ